ncbi:T9SS type A sorting domain-containing protein, partial [Flavitalea flava]
ATAELGTAYTGAITNGSYVTSTQATASSGCGAGLAISPALKAAEANKLFTGKIYPNPSSGLVQIEINTPVFRSATITVLDMFGRNLYLDKKALIKGNNTISLNIAFLPSGTYMIEVGDGKTILEKYKVLKL